jgi:FkbM family methyltransferase
MKKVIKNVLVYFFNPVAKKLGYVNRSSKNFQTGNVNIDLQSKESLLNTFYDNLKSINFIPKHIVDVGANHGTWTREALRYFPDAYYTLLEPQFLMENSIKDIIESNPKVKFNAVGAGEKEGSFAFTIVDRDDSCSFKYTAEEAAEKGYKQVNVSVVTLNNFLSGTGLPDPDIIKIDAEGLDIEVLKGTNRFFGKTEIFMVEAAVVNKGFKNSFLNIINFMDENGYTLFDVTDLNRPFQLKVLWLVELVFVKKNGLIDSVEVNTAA